MNKIILTLCLLLLAVAAKADYRYTFCICGIFQNEAPYLKEWIEFHKLVGVEHFYLYNHRSSDNYLEVLKPYVDSGLVDLVEVPTVADTIATFNPLQSKCYTECLVNTRGISKWIAFLDIDEYLFAPDGKSVREVLADYDGYGGIAVNWQIFGTSHVVKIPPGKLMIEMLTRCAPESYRANYHIKSIVRPERASHFLNPHHPQYLQGFYQVNTDKMPFEGRFSPYMRVNKLRINHYWTKDETFFYNVKIPRQQRLGGTPDPNKIQREMNAESNTAIVRYSKALAGALGIPPSSLDRSPDSSVQSLSALR